MSDPNANPNPNPDPNANPNPNPNPTPAWHGYTDPADVQYVENKGWKSGADAAKAYRDAEKFIGRDPNTLLAMPRADDPAGLLAVFDKLGRPATADKYEFAKPPEGLTPDPSYEKFARATFHEIGLLPAQVKQLTEKHNAYVKSVMEQNEKDYQTAVETDKAALLAEWKNGHERMMGVAEAAAQTLGFTPEMMDAMERTVGYAGTYKFMADLGKKLGEPGFKIGDGAAPVTGMLTPQEAKAEWDKLTLDQNFMSALKDKAHPGNAAAQAKQNQLYKVMYPEK